jgi:pilus assembly protein CpaC
VRAKAEIPVAFCCALFLLFCADSNLRAQDSPPPTQPMVPAQDSTNELSVAVGKTVLVDLARPISRVSIGLGDIAETHAISPTEVMVNGKAPGETSLIIWDTKGGRQFFNITVRASTSAVNDNLESIRRELRLELPGQVLKVSNENGNIFLRGTVKDLTSSRRAVEIAAMGGKVVNLLDVNVPASDPQVLLKVRFASVDRDKAKQLGINFFSSGFGNTLGGISTGEYSPPSITPGTSGPNGAAATLSGLSSGTNIFGFLPGLNVGATLQALETTGVVETLAEPNILAVNGKEASFLAGGEYPYPVAQGSSSGLATITIMFKEYGIRLNFVPTVTPRGTIRLQVAPEVSTLDTAHSVEVSGFDVPAITSRKMKTEVELADGQSFIIAGLLDNEETDSFQKIPFLGDIPVLGKFFQSMTKTKTNTELIVICTAELVAPIPAGDPLPQLKYPEKFLPQNSGIPMNNPDAKTAANTRPPAPASIPIETLLDSMKPETPMVIEGTGGGFGTASGSTQQPSTSSGVSSSPSP